MRYNRSHGDRFAEKKKVGRKVRPQGGRDTEEITSEPGGRSHEKVLHHNPQKTGKGKGKVRWQAEKDRGKGRGPRGGSTRINRQHPVIETSGRGAGARKSTEHGKKKDSSQKMQAGFFKATILKKLII